MKKYSFTISLILVLVFSLSLVALAADKPEDIYAKYHNAIKKGDMDTMLACVCKQQRDKFKELDKAKQTMTFSMIQAMQPVSYKVTKSDVKASEATLQMDGKEKPTGGKSNVMKGTVSFVKEDGKWVILKENWNTTAK